MNAKPIQETLGVVSDVLGELKSLVDKGQGASELLQLLQWLDHSKALQAVIVRSAVVTQSPMGEAMARRWKRRGLAIQVVNGPPPALKSRPLESGDGGQKVKATVPR